MKSEYWQNKKILITGGTSGLGRALALTLDAAGAKVAVVARNRERIEALRARRPTVIGIQGDVSDKRQIYPIAGQAEAQLGGVDILFNVASELGPTPLRLLLDTECEDFEHVLQTNLLGPFRLTKALLPAMVLRRRGIVVNISSDAGVNAYPRWGAYGVSKAALDHLTKTFAEELREHGVHFLAIDPGDMNTPMHFAAIPGADASALREPQDSAERIIRLIAQEQFSPVRSGV